MLAFMIFELNWFIIMIKFIILVNKSQLTWFVNTYTHMLLYIIYFQGL